VEATESLNEKKLVERLRQLSQDYDSEYGILVKQLEEPYFSNQYQTIDQPEEPEQMLTRPIIVYKVYAKDGHTEPVRGLKFDEVSLRSLRDIVAIGKEPQVYNMTQPTVFPNFRYPVAIVTPSILVEEMELKKAAFQEPLPILHNPIFAK
jgi:hypothetical protein